MNHETFKFSNKYRFAFSRYSLTNHNFYLYLNNLKKPHYNFNYYSTKKV